MPLVRVMPVAMVMPLVMGSGKAKESGSVLFSKRVELFEKKKFRPSYIFFHSNFIFKIF